MSSPMKRVIVDYSKLTEDILNLLVEKFPDGYDETDIIRFKNIQNEIVEAVEVRTSDTIYLVKVSKKLAIRMEKFDEDDDIVADIDAITPPEKDIDIDDDDIESDDDEDIDLLKDKGGSDDEDDDEDDFESSDDFSDDDEDDEE
jgi:hypothetical protein